MISKKLANGAQIIAISKPNTSLAVLNILVAAGSINETIETAGAAHFLEHMMFEGSKHFKDYDKTLQDLYGENNAFTCQDYTNYYQILPYENIEKSLELEIDRFQNLTLSEAKFQTQRNVIIEEYKETSLQPPLSDFWHKLLLKAFPNSSYKWPVIGYSLERFKNINRKDLISFYKSNYTPENLIFTLVSGQDSSEMIQILESYVSKLTPKNNNINHEVIINRSKKHVKSVYKRKNIQNISFFTAFHIADFGKEGYFEADAISDLLTNGESSILYQEFVKNNPICLEISSFITDNKHMNLLVFEGKLHQGVSYDRFKNQFDDLLNTFKKDLPNLQKMEMLKNKAETYFLFNNYSILNIAQNFSFWNYCDVRKEDILDRLQNLDAEKIKNISQSIFQKHNEIEIVYIPEIV